MPGEKVLIRLPRALLSLYPEPAAKNREKAIPGLWAAAIEPIGSSLMLADADGTILSVNAALRRTTGGIDAELGAERATQPA